MQRVLLCVRLDGALADMAVPEDVCIARVRWDGYVTQLDTLVYAASVWLNETGRNLCVSYWPTT